jgi:SAM-dependent methyltransferase
MVPLEASGPNAEQIRYWNDTAGAKWTAFQEVLDEQLRALGRRAMDRAAVAPHERVIDVGCGCGDTTIELGRRVGPDGTVVGIDLSTPMLERAVAQARAAQLPNVRFETADAQTHRFPSGQCDLVFSRFGVMFFADPAAAFSNLGTALRPGGRVAFVCWQSLLENPWLSVPLQVAARYITLPPPPAPGTPGPFSFADAERVRTILARAGFAEIAFADLREVLTIGGGASLDRTVVFLLEGVGPTSAALREADPAVRPKVAAAVREALAPFQTEAGVQMGSAAWIVTARR